MIRKLIYGTAAATAILVVWAPAAHADNSRLNNSVIANAYTVQRNIKRDPALTLAARWLYGRRAQQPGAGRQRRLRRLHAQDLEFRRSGIQGQGRRDRGDQSRLAINNLDVINQWYYDPVDFGIMSDCANTAIGVWSENSLDRSVVVAVFGQPD